MKAVLELPVAARAGLGRRGARSPTPWSRRSGPSPDARAVAIRGALRRRARSRSWPRRSYGGRGGGRAHPSDADRRRRRVPARVPAVGAAPRLAHPRLVPTGSASGASPSGRGAEVSRVDLWGLLFPVLFLVTAVAVVSRLLALAVRPAPSRQPGVADRRCTSACGASPAIGSPPSAWWPARPIAAGVLGYAATMNRSLDASLRRQGPHVRRQRHRRPGLGRRRALPAELTDRSTEVRGLPAAPGCRGRPRVRACTVIAIDPATFERAAFWDARSPCRAPRDPRSARAPPSAGEPVPAVVVGPTRRSGAEFVVDGDRRTDRHDRADRGRRHVPGHAAPRPDRVRGGVGAGPTCDRRHRAGSCGSRGDRVDSAPCPGAMPETAYHEVRTLRRRRRPGGVPDRVLDLRLPAVDRPLGRAAGRRGPGRRTSTPARRQRLLGYTFMRRMGLTARQHRRALAVELAASVARGSLVGLGIAVAGAGLAYERIDPVPGYRTGTRCCGWPARGRARAGARVRSSSRSWPSSLAQRRIDRDDPVEVLRAGA